MKLVKTLKVVLYIFCGIYISGFITGPVTAYLSFGGFESPKFLNALLYTLMHGVTGILICYHGAKVLKSFELGSLSFERINKSLQWIAYTLLAACIVYNIVGYYSAAIIDEAYWISSLGNTFMVIILALFFLAISQIIKVAGFYKNENDLTI